MKFKIGDKVVVKPKRLELIDKSYLFEGKIGIIVDIDTDCKGYWVLFEGESYLWYETSLLPISTELEDITLTSSSSKSVSIELNDILRNSR